MSEILYRFRLAGTDLYYGPKKGRFSGERTNLSNTGKFYPEKELKRLGKTDRVYVNDAQIKRHNIPAESDYGGDKHITMADLELVKYGLDEKSSIPNLPDDEVTKLSGPVGFPQLGLFCYVNDEGFWVENGCWQLSREFVVVATGKQLQVPTRYIKLKEWGKDYNETCQLIEEADKRGEGIEMKPLVWETKPPKKQSEWYEEF